MAIATDSDSSQKLWLPTKVGRVLDVEQMNCQCWNKEDPNSIRVF